MENTQTREQGIGAMSRSMLVVMILTMVSKMAGFLRETVLANWYGISIFTDAYKTAQLLPCIILSTIITAMCSTLIPAYSGQLKRGKAHANRFINNLYTVGMVLSVVILILTAIFMEPLAGMVVSRAEDPQVKALAVELAMIMMPMGIFVFLARITSAYLQANFNFAVPALSQLVLNVAIIGAIMLSRGANITTVAIGSVVGWALQFVVQIPSMRRTKLRYRPVFDLSEPGLREVIVLMVPVLISSLFDQLYILFDSMVAYGGNVGDPTALDYANRISTMVSSVLLTTVATVLYPSLVRHTDEKKKFTDNVSFGVNLNLLIALPATVAIILLSLPIARAVYERGVFTPEDTRLTAVLLGGYAAGILGVGFRELCNRCFYAYKQTRIPMIVGVTVVVLNIGLNYALHPIFGAAGIAVATSISSVASGAALLILLHKKQRVVDWRTIGQCCWKTIAATAAMAVVLLGLYQALHLGALAGKTLWLAMAGVVVAGVLVYVAALAVLKTKELWLLIDMLKKRLKKA